MNKSYIPPTTPKAITERHERMKSRGDDKSWIDTLDADTMKKVREGHPDIMSAGEFIKHMGW